MFGLVLWFSEISNSGMIWCEDQGPLAFIGPDSTLPDHMDNLACGDRLVFSIDERNGVRHVRDVFNVTRDSGSYDPRDILAGYHEFGDEPAAYHHDRPKLRVVA